MDRVRLIAGSRRWLLLAALALVSLALGSALFSGAKFTSRSANSAALVAGSVKLSSTQANQTIVSASAMKPGVSREGTLKITNEGDVAATMTLRGSGLTGAALAAVIDLKVEDTTSGTQKWSGKLAEFVDAGSVGVGLIGAGAARTYRVTLSWPSASNSASLQGASSSLTFQWGGSS
jgi:hypothetical protein